MDLLHSCEITCNIWILQTKNKKAYLDAAKFKTKNKIESLPKYNLHSNSKMCPRCVVSQSVIYVFVQENHKISWKKKKKLNISLFNHTYIFLHMAITLFNNSY